jgi:hypothetical protein
MKINKWSFNSILIIVIFQIFSSLPNIKTNQISVPNSIEEKLNFYNSHLKNFSNGKISIEYTENKGFFCKAQKEIKNREMVFSIKKDHILCSFDSFPLKFELLEALLHFTSHHTTNDSTDKSKIFLYLFSYYLILIEKGKVPEASKEMRDYLLTLPKNIGTVYEYDDDEIKFLNIIGHNSNIVNLKTVHSFVIKYLKEKFKNLDPYLLEILRDNLELFKSNAGIVSSRTYETYYRYYENFKNREIKNGPNGEMEKRIMENIPEGQYQPCFIAYSDLCNHYLGGFNFTNISNFNSSLNLEELEKNEKIINPISNINNIQIWKKDQVFIGYEKSFQAGEDYEFSYMSIFPNEKLLFSYGFYLDNNPYSYAHLKIKLNKNTYSKEKNEICQKLNCFPDSLEFIYKNTNIEVIDIFQYINDKKIDVGLMNSFRLMNFNETEFNETEEDTQSNKKDLNFVYKRLSKNKIIDYNNEMKSLSLYREYILNEIYNNKEKILKFEDIIYSLYNTDKFYDDFKISNTNSTKTDFYNEKYNIRKNILKLAREEYLVLLKQNYLVNREIKKVMSDQFDKIKKYFSE